MLSRRPIGLGAVAEKAALPGIIKLAGQHSVQGFRQHRPVKRFPGGSQPMEHKLQHGSGGKLGFLAETAVAGIIGPGNAAGNAVNLPLSQFSPGGDPVGVFLPLPLQLGGLVIQAGFILGVSPPHFRQHCQHLLRRQISSPGNGAAVRRQQGGSRPTADIVAGIHLGAVVVVHPYRHKIGGNEIGHRRVPISGFIHHLTPVAPYGGNGQ